MSVASCPAESALCAIMHNRLAALERLLARHPGLLRTSWRRLMTAVGALENVDTGALLLVLRPAMRHGRNQRSLDDPVDDDGNRVLHWACLSGDSRKVEVLLGFGANPRAANRLGTTPLFDAVRHGRREAVVAIAAADPAGLCHFNRYDCSPMHWACKHVSLPGMQALHGTDPLLINLPNRRGCHPLDVLEWRLLYHREVARRVHHRDATVDELRPFMAIRRWMRAHGARPSLGWARLQPCERLLPANAPLNAELWWRHVQPPEVWRVDRPPSPGWVAGERSGFQPLRPDVPPALS